MDNDFLETFLRWVRTLGEIIQWMISAIQEVPWLIIELLRSLISGLRLKQFPKLFYSQNSWVPETLLFQALFSQRKVSKINSHSSKILTTLSGFLLISQVILGSSLPWQLVLFWRRSVGRLVLVGWWQILQSSIRCVCPVVRLLGFWASHRVEGLLYH